VRRVRGGRRQCQESGIRRTETLKRTNNPIAGGETRLPLTSAGIAVQKRQSEFPQTIPPSLDGCSVPLIAGSEIETRTVATRPVP